MTEKSTRRLARLFVEVLREDLVDGRVVPLESGEVLGFDGEDDRERSEGIG